MINVLPQVVKDAKCLLFPNDLKVHLDINKEEDWERLKKDIDRVVTGSRNNFLDLKSTSKCVTMTSSPRLTLRRHTCALDGILF